MAATRWLLAMVVRVLDFSQIHPSTDPGFIAVLARLQDRATRADALAIQHRDGKAAESAAIARRNGVRYGVLEPMLRHLSQVASLAAKDNPDIAAEFFRPALDGPNNTFITAAKSMYAAATQRKDVFTALALGGTFLDDLQAALAEFDADTVAAHAAHSNKVGATAELQLIGREGQSLVDVLDGFNRARFRSDPELLAAWESARLVTGPLKKTPADVPVVDPPQPSPSVAVQPMLARDGGRNGGK